MSCPFSDEQLAQLKAFVDVCKNQPQLLLSPKLTFFKDYLSSLGVSLPTANFGAKNFTPSGDSNTNTAPDNKPDKNMSSEDESDSEEELQLDMEGIIEPDTVTDVQEMGDSAKEPTDEDRDKCDELRSKAMQAFSDQKYDEAVAIYTDAIKLNPQSALLFAKRGQVYLKLSKPNACIKDCTRALELNCDSAAAYKFRGRAYRLLGKFEEACHDLCESLKIDYEEQTNEWLAEVKPNAEKLRQHHLAQQRKKEDKEHRERLRRARSAQEARARAAAAGAGTGGGGGRGAPGGAGGFPGGFDYNDLLLDADLMAAFQDPEVSAAFQDVSANPANFIKYQDNPKVAAIIQKLQSKFPGVVPPGFGAPSGPGGKQSTEDDVGLD